MKKIKLTVILLGIINCNITLAQNVSKGILKITSNDTTYIAIDTTKSNAIYTDKIEPQFNGDLKAYLKKNIIYPQDALDKRIEGFVIVYCDIDTNGKILKPILLNEIYPSIDKDALRVVNSMPNWIPAKRQGRKIKSATRIYISYKLN